MANHHHYQAWACADGILLLDLAVSFELVAEFPQNESRFVNKAWEKYIHTNHITKWDLQYTMLTKEQFKSGILSKFDK